MLLLLLLTAVAAAPALDQRQEGEFNVRADVQNVLFLIAVPQKMPFPSGLLDNFLKTKPERMQERADVGVMEAFVEPSTPYRVEIGADERGGGADVVIAGRTHLRPGFDAQPEAEPERSREDFKLLGALEQCGPDRERDPVLLTCRERRTPAPSLAPTPAPAPAPAPEPQVIPVS